MCEKNPEMSRFRFTFASGSLDIRRGCKFLTVSFVQSDSCGIFPFCLGSRGSYASAYIMVIGSCACWRWGDVPFLVLVSRC